MGKKALYQVVTAGLLLSVSAVVYIGIHRSGSSALRRTAEDSSPALAPDVEFRLKDFEFNNFVDGNSTIQIKAKSMVRRGRKFLAFRSSLIKDNLFEEITGRLVSPKSKVTFSSDHAEGNMDAFKSLFLINNVVITINGKRVPVNHSARVNFRDCTIEIDEKKQISY